MLGASGKFTGIIMDSEDVNDVTKRGHRTGGKEAEDAANQNFAR